MELTAVWLLRFRNLLDQMYDCPPPAREEIAARIHKKPSRDKAGYAPIRFMPGQRPGDVFADQRRRMVGTADQRRPDFR